MSLKLGLSLGFWGPKQPAGLAETIVAAEKLGYDCVFTAEAYGSDVFSPLAWFAAQTSRIRLGSGIAQLSARTPTATAMHALTIDHLSQGRMILGLGVSGPQVVEGWYGQPFAKPLARTREYVDICRQVLAREAPVKNAGPHYPIPYAGENSWGQGKPLKPVTHPFRPKLPIVLGAEGPKNVALAAEICDGWLPLYYSPFRQEVYADAIQGRSDDFEIFQSVTLKVTDDVEKALAPIKAGLGFYVGGMGSRTKNFHKDMFARYGFEAEAQKIQDLFLDGKREEAFAAVPDQFCDEVALVGSPERIRDRLQAWKDSPITHLLVVPESPEQLAQAAELVLG